MVFLVRYIAPADIETTIKSDRKAEVLGAIDGFVVEEGTVLDHLGASLPGQSGWRGGLVQLKLERLRAEEVDDDKPIEAEIVVEIETGEQLSLEQLEKLRRSLDGQMSDGIGAGGFEPISAQLPVSIEPLSIMSDRESRISQTAEANAVLESAAGFARQNRDRLAAAKAALAAPQRALRSQQDDPYKPLLKLLAVLPPEPSAKQRAAVAAALAAADNDLSQMPPRKFPYNFIADLGVVQMLLDAGLNPNLRDKEGHALLYLLGDNCECVRLALDKGADVNAINDDKFKDTALKRAARVGNAATVMLLLERGADPNIKAGMKSTTALEDSRANNHSDALRLLEAAG